MTNPNDLVALDALHDQCVAARAALRADFRQLQAWAEVWEPRPCPPIEVWR